MSESELNTKAIETANYLYKIEESEVIGKLTPELFQAISTLRQLINEEFVHKGKSVSSQLIYDILMQAITEYMKTKMLEIIGEDDNIGVDPDWPWAKSKHRDDLRTELRAKVREMEL